MRNHLASGENTLHTIHPLDVSLLHENAQHELYDFFLFLKQKYPAEHSENRAEEASQKQQERMKKLKALKVEAFTPLCRDEIYDQ